jgi:hypothetical protein
MTLVVVQVSHQTGIQMEYWHLCEGNHETPEKQQHNRIHHITIY